MKQVYCYVANTHTGNGMLQFGSIYLNDFPNEKIAVAQIELGKSIFCPDSKSWK